MIKVESGIPIPRPHSTKMKYPWHEMKVGDSFLAPNVTQYNVMAAISRHRSRHGGKFTTRKVEGGVRVWRIE